MGMERDSPDDSQTAVNTRGFPAFLQGRSAIRTATVTRCGCRPRPWVKLHRTIGRTIMAKDYWVAFADVNDPEGYKAYIAENAKAFRKYGGRFLTRGGKSEAPEG